MFLAKREESRNFDVCFGCFLVFGREKNKCVERLGKMRISKKSVSSLSVGCLGLFIALGAFFEAATLQGPSASKGLKMCGSWYPWKDLDFQFLKKCGTQKSNGWIKSYDSGKLAVHQSVC